MKTINDIKYVLFSVDEKSNPMVEKFLSLSGKIFIEYKSDKDLSEKLAGIKNNGVNSKEVVVIKKFLGRTCEICPGSPKVICCNYHLINTGFNCLFNCSYCYLRTYLNTFGIMVFSNYDYVLENLDVYIKKFKKDRIYRVGTGEYTDSLMIDEFTEEGRNLISALSSHKNIMLEFKTKSGQIDHLLEIREKGNTVVSWSLNTERNIFLYEKGTASLHERMEAASKAAKAGYYVAFHFDPVILYEGWKDDYKKVISLLFGSVDPKKIVWISLGGLRFTRDFKEILSSDVESCSLILEEQFPSIDGKYRYFKPKRKEIYAFFKNEISGYVNNAFLYMCMETTEMWKDIFGYDFGSSFDLEMAFSEHIKKHFISSW